MNPHGLSRGILFNNNNHNNDNNNKTGADLGFSQGGVGFSKNFENFVDLFLGRSN